MIGVVDFGIGNVASVVRMSQKAGFECQVVKDPAEVGRSSRLIFPGVGHYATAMDRINRSGLRQTLDEVVLGERKPILGICLGAQVFGTGSEEGDVEGLGWLNFRCVQFPPSVGRIPHMQWNTVTPKGEGPLSAVLVGSRYYFVHSFFFEPEKERLRLGDTLYGREFCSVVGERNILGVQFHPEKSLRWGLTLVREFCAGRLTT